MALVKKILLSTFIVFLFVFLFKNINEYQKQLQFYQEYKKEYEKEKYQNQKLKTEVIKKKSLAELEKNIRNKLNLTKENEMIILMDNQPNVTIANFSSPNHPNWKKWWLIFFKK